MASETPDLEGARKQLENLKAELHRRQAALAERAEAMGAPADLGNATVSPPAEVSPPAAPAHPPRESRRRVAHAPQQARSELPLKSRDTTPVAPLVDQMAGLASRVAGLEARIAGLEANLQVRLDRLEALVLELGRPGSGGMSSSSGELTDASK